MIPIVQTLLSNGLGLLANAVISKGQEAVEEKLGIKLDAAPLSSLREKEIEHEEFLLSISIKDKELELKDVEGARTLGIELSKSQYWLAANVMPILALFTVSASFLVLILSKENDVRMAAVSMGTMVLGYFFGSSVGSKNKQELIERLQK
jgi:hypothetical protein